MLSTITNEQFYDAFKTVADAVSNNRMQTDAKITESALPNGAATAAKQDEQTAQLQTIAGIDFATDTNLQAVLDALNAIKGTDGIKKIVDAVDVSDRAGRALGKITADDNAIAALGALAAAAVTDPAASASVIALLKGLLKQLQGIGTGAAPVQLTGSNALKAAVQTVTTAGTRVQLPNYACREVTIIALRTNTGRIFVGGSDVSSTIYGADLGPEDSITLSVKNTNLIYIDAAVNGEGISYVAL